MYKLKNKKVDENKWNAHSVNMYLHSVKIQVAVTNVWRVVCHFTLYITSCLNYYSVVDKVDAIFCNVCGMSHRELECTKVLYFNIPWV